MGEAHAREMLRLHYRLAFFMYKNPLLSWLGCSLICQMRHLWRAPFLCAWTWMQWLAPSFRMPAHCIEDAMLHSCDSCIEVVDKVLIKRQYHDDAIVLSTERGIRRGVLH